MIGVNVPNAFVILFAMMMYFMSFFVFPPLMEPSFRHTNGSGPKIQSLALRVENAMLHNVLLSSAGPQHPETRQPATDPGDKNRSHFAKSHFFTAEVQLNAAKPSKVNGSFSLFSLSVS